MALAGVVGAIGRDAADLLVGRDLVEQFRQHGRVAYVAGGELDGPDLQGFLIDPDMDLAPDTALRATVLAGVPLPFALDLDAGAIDQEVQRPLRPAIGDIDLQRLLPAAQRGSKSGTAQSRPISRSKLSTNPVVCLSAMPKSTFSVRQV